MVGDILMESNDQKSKDARNFGSTRIQQIQYQACFDGRMAAAFNPENDVNDVNAYWLAGGFEPTTSCC